jgi:imidazolonepropionase-like amidohydrolase
MNETMGAPGRPGTGSPFLRGGGRGYLRLALGLAVWAALAAAPGPVQGQAPAVVPVAVVGVTVIDTRTGTRRPDVTVVTDGPRVVAAGPRRTVAVPRGATVIDGRGRYLLPGLWDMHTHLATFPVSGDTGAAALAGNAEYYFPLLLASGVVGVRDMSGDLATLRRWRDEVRVGTRLGPQLVVTGEKLERRGRVVLPGRRPRPNREFATVAAELAAGGADFFKVDGVGPAGLDTVQALARAAGLPVAGHLPPTVPLDEAVARGFWSVEHLQGVLDGCSALDDERTRDARAADGWWRRLLARLRLVDERARAERWTGRLLAAQDHERCRALGARLAAGRTWLTPTLVALAAQLGARGEVPADRLPLLPEAVRRRGPAAEPGPLGPRVFDTLRVALGVLARAGAPLLAGTDLPGNRRVPGLSLVDELELLAGAGVPALGALQAATLGPARALGREGAGEVAPGAPADLLLLDADPLADLGNLRRVRAVVAGGRYLPRPVLDSLVAAARARVAGWNRAAAPAR